MLSNGIQLIPSFVKVVQLVQNLKAESVDTGLPYSSVQEGQQITTRILLRTGTLEMALMLLLLLLLLLQL
jgi:hypothetical protein